MKTSAKDASGAHQDHEKQKDHEKQNWKMVNKPLAVLPGL
jgi:hypothetical protein